MRIAMIGQKGLPAVYGGVEQHVHELATSLIRHGHDVTAYARRWYTGGDIVMLDGVRIIHVPTVKTKHLDAIVHTFLATIHALREGVDVIHYHSVGPSLLSFIPRLVSPKTRVIATFHSIDRYHQKWNWFARLILKLGEWAACKFPHETISISRGIRQYCQNEYHKETAYIPYGINRTNTALPAIDTLTAFHLEPQKYLVMVSRLVPHKGAHLLIEAFTNLKRKYHDDATIRALKLVIVGGSVYTDEYVMELHRLAAQNNDIVFTGFQNGTALEALYRHATALVHPSLNEGLPMTVLGAMAHGTPALVSSIPEHAELISDPRCLFHENDVMSIEHTIYDFLQLNSQEKKEIVERNFQTLEREYDWNALTPQIISLYEEKKSTPHKLMKEMEQYA